MALNALGKTLCVLHASRRTMLFVQRHRYGLQLNKLMVVMLSFDGVVEFANALWGMLCLNPPHTKAERKRRPADEDGVTYDDVMKYMAIGQKVGGSLVRHVVRHFRVALIQSSPLFCFFLFFVFWHDLLGRNSGVVRASCLLIQLCW
jgi:hypothetical protein